MIPQNVHVDEKLVDNKEISQKVAVIYALPTYHEEVNSAVACILDSLGFYVVAYIGNGIHVGSLMLPLSGKPKRHSSLFYGSCVSRWITISPTMEYSVNIDLLVFPTYPVIQAGGVPDPLALEYLKRLTTAKSETPVIYISHRSDSILKSNFENESLSTKNRFTFLFVAEHVYKNTEQNLKTNIILDYFFPVLPSGYVLPSTDSLAYRPTFVVQGNFGGRHASRKNVTGLIRCLNVLENKTLDVDRSSNLTLDLVGHVAGNLDLPKLTKGKVRTVSDLPHREFYQALSRGKFMLLGLGEKDYQATKATSSVPAALIAGIPIVFPKALLQIYPCLREAKIHQKIAQVTECKSIYAAMQLNDKEYREAKNEVKNCSELYFKNAQNVFNHAKNS